METLRLPLSSDILHALFPSVRAELLRRLFSDPTREFYVRELARLTTLALIDCQQELARMSKPISPPTWSNAPAHARRTRALDQKITAARVLLERSGTTHAKCPSLTEAESLHLSERQFKT